MPTSRANEGATLVQGPSGRHSLGSHFRKLTTSEEAPLQLLSGSAQKDDLGHLKIAMS